jgi:signal transduction histidine kinase
VRREREVARANEQALRETNRQMETFLSIAGHELKTPLTSLMLGLEQLLRRLQQVRRSLAGGVQDAAPQVEALHWLAETMLQQGGRLNRLVNELLDTTCIQAGQFELHRQPADLGNIVRTTVQEQRLTAPDRTILLQECVEGHVPVSADAERLGQVVTNLLSNALKYSGAASPVEVGIQVEGEHGRLWVRDQGPGIPLNEQERLWERFHRVPGMAVQSGSDVGLGIGLYLSRTIIELHGGQVGVQSTPGAGSTFWCTLPLASDRQGQDGTAWEELTPPHPPLGQAEEPGKSTPRTHGPGPA